MTPPRVFRRRSDTVLLLLVLPPALVQIAFGVYFGWPLTASPITQPLGEVVLAATTAFAVGFVTTVPALLEFCRRRFPEAWEEGEDAA